MSRRSARWVPSPVTALLLSVAIALAGNMATNVVQPPESWDWWPWAVWTVVGLLVAASVWVQYAQSRPVLGSLDAGVMTDLAKRLEEDWADEAVRREVTRPAPLRVSWSSTGRPAASRETVIGDSSGGDWQRFPLRGQTDALNAQIVAAFRSLPRRQMMVLGEPGAGKSVFAMLLTLGLIRSRVEDEPVPVLLAINMWDPAEPVDKFVARRLAEDYADTLTGYGDPQAVADRLVRHRQVMPVLDGLDELDAIDPALRALDDYAAAGRPLVVTCRVREYEQAVTRSETILTTAAVVELEPVTIDAAIDYLSHPEPARPRWEPVFAHLRSHPDGDEPGAEASADPLARALSTPLMVALARTAYQHPATDPAELLKLETQQEVTGRLMDAFVTATYTPRRDDPTHGDDPARAPRRWLSCLAYHLYQAGTRDLHWWQIHPGLLAARPHRAAAITTATAVALGGLIAALLGASTEVSGGGAALTGIAITSTAASGWLRPMWPHGYPRYIQVRFRTRRRRRIEQVALPLGYGIGGGLLTALITTGWAAAIPAGLVCGLLTAVLPPWRPGPPTRRTTAATIELAHNRRNITAAALQQALTSGAVFTLAGALTGIPMPLTISITAAMVYGSTAALVAGGWTWTRFRMTHTRLALRGWLPWRLQPFLTDAHHRAVLRQAGPVYQFRHAILQDHLAHSPHTHHLQLQADAGDRDAARRLADLLNNRDKNPDIR